MIRSSAGRNSLITLLSLFFAGVLAATPASANEVVALKNALYGAGYEINNVTPEMDPATRSALESYQQAQGLVVTGELDDATRDSLGLGGVNLASASSGSSTSSSGSASASDSSAPEQPAETEQEEAAEEEEEDDDGGWSFW